MSICLTFQSGRSPDSSAFIPQENPAACQQQGEAQERDLQCSIGAVTQDAVQYQPGPLELPRKAGLVVLGEPRVEQAGHVWVLPPTVHQISGILAVFHCLPQWT